MQRLRDFWHIKEPLGAGRPCTLGKSFARPAALLVCWLYVAIQDHLRKLSSELCRFYMANNTKYGIIPEHCVWGGPFDP